MRRNTSSTSWASRWCGCSSRPDAATGAARRHDPPHSPARWARSSSRSWSSRPRPASAHATLLTTEPQNGGVYDKPPSQVITLRFSEAGGGLARRHPRLHSPTATASSPASPEHPNGTQSEVAVVVAEARRRHVRRHLAGHLGRLAPGRGRVHVPGRRQRRRQQEERAGRRRLAAGDHGWQHAPSAWCTGSTAAVLFGALALLIGGVVFLVAVWPRGRDDRRAARVVWGGWIGVAVTTVLGIALEGVYARRAAARRKVFDPTRVPRRARHPLRQGRARAARRCSWSRTRCCACCCTAGTAAEHPLRGWWMVGRRPRRRRARGHARHRGSRGHRHPDRARDPGRPRARAGDGVLARRPRGAVLRGPAPSATSTSCARCCRGTPRSALGAIVALVVSGRVTRRGARSAASTCSRAPTTEAADRQAGRVRGADRRRRVQPRGREPPVPRPTARRRGVRRPSTTRCSSAPAAASVRARRSGGGVRRGSVAGTAVGRGYDDDG